MGYDSNPSMVRVDFFKESGKWYCTESVKWRLFFNTTLIHAAFRDALRNHLKGRLEGMTAVCLHPYHELECPLMISDWSE